VSPADALTPFTAGGFTVKLAAGGGTLGARHDATAITHDADGYYAVELDGTDTATVGRLKVEVPGSAGNYLPTWDEFFVLSAAVYDTLTGSTALSTYGGSDTAGTTTLLSRIGSAITIASGKVAATMGSTDYTGNTVQTGDAYARIGATGSGLTSLAPSATALSTAQWTNARAALLDNLDAAVSTRLATASYTAPDNADVISILASVGSGLKTELDAVKAKTDALPTFPTNFASLAITVGGATTAGTVSDKAGYSLASSGLDAISTTAPAGVASNYREMMVQLWRRFFKKSAKAASGTTLKTYADDGTTVITTQTWSDDGANNETLGAAS